MANRFLQPAEIKYGNSRMRVKIRFAGAEPRTIERGPTGARVRTCLESYKAEKIRVVEKPNGYEIKCMRDSDKPKSDEKFYGIVKWENCGSGHIVYTVEPDETQS